MNAKIKTTRAVFCDGNGRTLTPYVGDDGSIWLSSDGDGCGDDVMLTDLCGMTDAEINESWDGIDLDALRADAEEVRAAGDADSADCIEDWCARCEKARKGFVEPEMIGDEATLDDAEAVAEYLNEHGYSVRASDTESGGGVGVPERTWRAALDYAAEKNGWNDYDRPVWFTADADGNVGCHDATHAEAEFNRREMAERYPDAEWEVLHG